MKKCLILLLVAACVMSVVASNVFAADKVYELKYAGVLSAEHPVSRSAVIWADKLKEMSGGRVTVDLYVGGSMGKSTEVIEYIQQGTLAFSVASSAFFSSFDKKFDIFSLPYLFKDKDHMYRAVNGEFGEYMNSLLLDDGLRILCYPDSGSRSVYTKEKPVNTPADMDGVKIRVMSKVAVNSMNALGANGVPIPWGELYTSLQTGVVDAAENNPPSIISGKHYEVCNYYSLTQHFRTPDIFIMSEKVYQDLPEDLQKIVVDSIMNVFLPTQLELFAEDTLASMEKVKEYGMEINEIADLTPFMELTAPVREDVAKEIDMYDWVKNIEGM